MQRLTRRTVLASLSVSTLGFAGCSTPVGSEAVARRESESPPSEWPTFRLNERNTGFVGDVTEPDAEPEVAWTVDTDAAVWASPVVVDGTVYIAGTDSRLYAIDVDSGVIDWQFQAANRIEGTPAVYEGTVYVGSYDQTVYALEATTGDIEWQRTVDGLVRGSPTVVDDTVYIGVGCFTLACAGHAEEAGVPKRGWLYALDAETGEIEWTHEIDDELVSTPAAVDDTVYVGGFDSTLYALDARSGTIEWEFETRNGIWASPTVDTDTVYCADFDAVVYAVDADTGEERWQFETFGAYISASTAVDRETVYVGTTPRNVPGGGERTDAEVFALDRRTGEKRWEYETDALEIGSSPVVTDDTLYIGAHSQGEESGLGIYALTTGGDERWVFEVGARGVGSSPALLDGRLYFGGTDGRVYALE